jgi:hypothetical protein
MPLDPAAYVPGPARHAPPGAIEVVAYARRDGGFDVFAFEPAGVLPPAWEAQRVDADHVFLIHVDTEPAIELAARAVARKLGPAYEKVVGFRETEPGAKAGVNRRLQRLHKQGATGYAMRLGDDGRFELVLRRHDLPLIAGL